MGETDAQPTSTSRCRRRRPAASEVILVVEDNEDVRAYSVTSCANSATGCWRPRCRCGAGDAQSGMTAIDLLFTDVVLPGQERARIGQLAQAAAAGLRVLFTTGYSRNAIVHHGRLRRQDVHLISKPFTFDQLATRIRDVHRPTVGKWHYAKVTSATDNYFGACASPSSKRRAAFRPSGRHPGQRCKTCLHPGTAWSCNRQWRCRVPPFFRKPGHDRQTPAAAWDQPNGFVEIGQCAFNVAILQVRVASWSRPRN